MSEPKTECGCTGECLHKPGCVFERKASAELSEYSPEAWEIASRYNASETRALAGEIDEELNRLRNQLVKAAGLLETAHSLIEAGDDLYASTIGNAQTPFQKEALVSYADLSNEYRAALTDDQGGSDAR